MIPYGHQSIDEGDVQAVIDVLRGDWLTQGPAVERFEADLCAVTGAEHAVAFSSGTAALHAAAWAAGLGAGDTVATSPLSFVASANCARYVGANVRFVDIDAATLNLDLDRVPADVDALVAVHFSGLPVDLRNLVARPRVVIEDAAHALGALTPDGPVGNCANSDLCCFSFHPVKTITTGEGGAVTTNSPHLATRLRRFRHHGIRPTPDEGGWCYDVEEIGFNYRLTDLQAALGSSQLSRLEQFVLRRNEIAARYAERLGELPIGLPPTAPDRFRHAYHLYPVQIAQRRRAFDSMRASGIGVQVHYVPTYRFSAFSEAASRVDFPETERVYERLVSLPMYPALTESQLERVVGALRDFCSSS